MTPSLRIALAAMLFTSLITGQPAYAEETEVDDGDLITCENFEQNTLSNFGGKLRGSKKLFDRDTPVRAFLTLKGGSVSYCEDWQDVRERSQPSQKTFSTIQGKGCDVDTREGFQNRRIVSSSALQVVLEPELWESESMATVNYATYFPNENKLIVVKQANTTPVGLSKSYFQTSDTQIFTCD